MGPVHEDVTADRSGTDRPVLVAPPHRSAGPAPCAAHPGSRLVHPDGRCQCFFGGPAPEFGAEVPLRGSALP